MLGKSLKKKFLQSFVYLDWDVVRGEGDALLEGKGLSGAFLEALAQISIPYFISDPKMDTIFFA